MDKKIWVYLLLLFAVVTFAYKNHFTNPFEFDDSHTIVTNYYIRDIKNIPLFFKDAATFSSLPSNQSYRPVVTTLNAIDCWLGGKAEPIPFYFHRSIFISFLILGIFVFLLSRELFNKATKHVLNDYIAFIVTAVFLLHTANVETISYVISRSDSFSGLMMVLSIFLFACFKNGRKYFLYLIPIIIGFLTKETAAMTPALLFFYVLLFEEDSSLQNAILKVSPAFKSLMAVLPALLLTVVLFLFGQKMIAQTWSSGGSDKIHYWLTETFVLFHYVNNFFFPFNLSADTDWILIQNPFDDRVVVGTLFLILSIIVTFKCSVKRELRPISYGILWFYIAQLPTTIMPFSEVLNDHRPFLPYVGLSIAFVWALFRLYVRYEESIKKNPLYNYAILSLLLCFFALHVYGIRQRSYVWSSSEILWKDVTEKSPHNGRGLMNYGNALMAKGDYQGALTYFNKAKQEWPYYSYVYVNLGVVYSAMNNMPEAETNFKYALQLNDKSPDNFQFYALALKNHNRAKEALALIDRGLALSPQHITLNALKNEINSNPALIASAEERLALIEKNTKATPTSDNYINLSLEYYNVGRFLDCVKACEEALKIKPNNDIAYNNICSAYNMLKDYDNAILAGQKAVELNPKNQLAKNNLKAAQDGKKKNS